VVGEKMGGAIQTAEGVAGVATEDEDEESWTGGEGEGETSEGEVEVGDRDVGDEETRREYLLAHPLTATERVGEGVMNAFEDEEAEEVEEAETSELSISTGRSSELIWSNAEERRERMVVRSSESWQRICRALQALQFQGYLKHDWIRTVRDASRMSCCCKTNP
jgi:hypothetical protein